MVADLDYARLEAILKALSSANRLQLLGLLESPQELEDLRLKPGAAQAGASPQRPISRQAVLRHLDVLAGQQLVHVRRGKTGANQYVADRTRLYALLEDLRQVARLGSPLGFDAAQTVQVNATATPAWPPGPKLVLVRGAEEGKLFPLHERHAKSGWSIGRKAGSSVCLDYDPYVSAHNAQIAKGLDGYVVSDVAAAKNGTWLNWRALDRGQQVPLHPGDVVGVGRSLLVFRPH